MPTNVIEWRHSLAVDAARSLIHRGEPDRAASVLADGPPVAADGTALPWPSDLERYVNAASAAPETVAAEDVQSPQADDWTPFDDLEDW